MLATSPTAMHSNAAPPGRGQGQEGPVDCTALGLQGVGGQIQQAEADGRSMNAKVSRGQG
jgi:hypothetical protein